MPSQLALLIYFVIVVYLFKLDYKRNAEVSGAIWIPLIWMLIIGSKPISNWLGLQFGSGSPDDYLEGNPFDRNIFTVLLVIAAVILMQRKIIWHQILKGNIFILLYFLYCGISILWSDYPYVSLKRYTKEITNLLMVLIVLTDHDPGEALKTIFRRFAYVLIPLSILLYKYFPDLGRTYLGHEGSLFFIGAASSKNGLGLLCFVCGLFFFRELLRKWFDKNVTIDKKKALINYLFMGLAFWLLIKSESMTSLICFIAGIIILLMMEAPFIRRNVNLLAICVISLAVIFQFSTDIMSSASIAIGRDPTLTGRTEIWKDILNMGTNPLIGCGYNSFWLGDRMALIWEKYWFHPTQAHNGYIEIYVTLGIIGLFLLMVIIISAFRNISTELVSNHEYADFKMTFLVVSLLDFISESTLIAGSLTYFIFMLTAVNVPSTSQLQNTRQNTYRG